MNSSSSNSSYNDNDNDNNNTNGNDNNNNNNNGLFYFAKKRFQYLVDWDPTSLTRERNSSVYRNGGGSSDGLLPLHLVLLNNNNNTNNKTTRTRTTCKISIQNSGFQTVLCAGMYYYPTRLGFLFHQHNTTTTTTTNPNNNEYEESTSISTSRTPFQLACKKYGKKAVMEVVNDVVVVAWGIHSHSRNSCSSTSSSSNNTTTSGNSSSSSSSNYNNIFVESLITAAIDETIHLDCLYFLLQKQPSILSVSSSLSLSLQAASSSKLWKDGHGDSNDDDDIAKNLMRTGNNNAIKNDFEPSKKKKRISRKEDDRK